MSPFETIRCLRRIGTTSPVVVALLVAILITLLVLLAAILRQNTSAINQVVSTPPPPKPIEHPERIREVAHEGKTYRSEIKGNFEARVEDKDWGGVYQKTVNLAYGFDAVVNRKIVTNDGQKIIEERQFEKIQVVKILSDVEVKIDLGPQGEFLLDTACPIAVYVGHPEVAEAIVAVKSARSFAQTFMKNLAEKVTDDNTKVFTQLGSLAGKKVRVTYVAGLGVESFTEIEGTLTPSEKDFVHRTAVLADYYMFPDVKIEEGKDWSVDGSQFIGFLDPSLHGEPVGEIWLKRGNDQDVNGKSYANLSVVRGDIKINGSDENARRIGAYTPRGTLQYNLADSYVESAKLQGDATIEKVSKNHILFESRFKTQPRLKIVYSCKMD